MGLRNDKAAVEAAYAAAETAWEDEQRELTAQCEHADARAFQSEGLCLELGEQLEAATRANAEALAEMCALRAVMKGASRADAQAEAEALAEALAEVAEAEAAARELLPPRSPVTHHSPSPGHTPHKPLLSPRAPAEPPLDGYFQGLERASKPVGRSTGGGGGGYSGGGPSGAHRCSSSTSTGTSSPGKRRRNSGERDPGPLASMDPVGERAPFSWTPTMTSARAGSDVWPRVNTSNAAARRGAGAPGSQADKYDRLRRFTPAFTPAQAASMAAGGYARSTKQQAPPPRPPAPPPGAAGAETQSASAKVVTVDLFT